jgi:hypothetical protein
VVLLLIGGCVCVTIVRPHNFLKNEKINMKKMRTNNRRITVFSFFYFYVGGVLLVCGGTLLSMEQRQQLALMGVGAGSAAAGTLGVVPMVAPALMPSVSEQGQVGPAGFIAQFLASGQQHGGDQAVVRQVFDRLLFVRQCRWSHAQTVFSLHNTIDALRKQLEAAEKRLSDEESSFQRQDPGNMERIALDDLCVALEGGASLAVSDSRYDQQFLLYLREQACAHRKAIILTRLLQIDRQARTDIERFGLCALTDNPGDVTGNMDKLEAIMGLGINLGQLKSDTTSIGHKLVFEEKEEVVRRLIERDPAVLAQRDSKGRTLNDIAVIRYINALVKYGRRSSEYEESFKILNLFATRPQQAQLQAGAQ